MSAVFLDSSFGTLLCTLSTGPLDPLELHVLKVLVKLLDDPALCTLLAPESLGVSAFATILHFQTLARSAHSTKSPVEVGQSIPFESVGKLPV